MKKKIVYIFILLASIIIQTSLIPIVTDLRISPDVVLMMILAFSVLDGFHAFLPWAIFAGILYDLASYSLIGTHVIIFLAVVYFVSFFSRRFSMELKGVGLILFFLFIVFSTVISSGAVFWELSWGNALSLEHWKIWKEFASLGFQVLYNSILFFLWFLAIRKTKKFFDIR